MQVISFILSVLLTILFFIYGFNHYYLQLAARKYQSPALPDGPLELPPVAIHLPVFNERYVVRRLVAACSVMAETYGIEKVSILILDDSNDDTALEVDRVVEEYAEKKFKIKTLRREDRLGFKAGALQAALERTDEDFFAVFDADFIPPPDFLLRTLPYFINNENLGVVQSRWTHLNREYNFLTRAIALGIDVHFFVEQPGRFFAGCFQNFNGSGGVLRKKAVLQAGGWSADTLAEDLDLSYRMQQLGFQVLFLKDVQCPGEVPPTIPSFKRQQGRWACGSLRTARKILPGLLRDRRINLKQRMQAFIHLSGYMIQPLMVFSFLLTCLVTLFQLHAPAPFHPVTFTPTMNSLGIPGAILTVSQQNLIWAILFPVIILCTLAPWMSILTTMKAMGLSLLKNLFTLLVLLSLGFGLSLSNTREAGKALLTNRIWDFTRTPKYADLPSGQAWRLKRYQSLIDPIWIAELIFFVLGLVAMGSALRTPNLSLLLILFPFTVSYGFIFLFSVLQSRRTNA